MPVRGTLQVVVVAVQDVWHERWMAVCTVLGLAAVLAPLLVLFGLKHGIISTLVEDLRASPEARHIQPLGQGRFDAAWLAALGQRPEVGFLMPTTRYLSATLELLPPNEARARGPLRAEMLPSAPGDPLWEGPAVSLMAPEAGSAATGVVLSTPLAEKLNVAAGQAVDARLGRVVAGRLEAVRLVLDVVGVMPLEASSRDVVLVPLELLVDAEDYREGYAVPRRGWPGKAAAVPEDRRFASFRLYAVDIDAVRPLRDHLAELAVETESAVDRIAMTRRLDHALTVLFLLVSTLAVGGYGLSLALSQAVTVARKQQDISVLKMLGAGNTAVALFPVTQAALTGLLGGLVAVAVQAAAEPLINRLFATSLREGQVVSRLLPEHIIWAVAGTVALASATATVAGWRAASQPPAKGLRHD